MSKGLYGTYALLSFNSRLAKRELHQECIRILKDSVKAWVQSATEGQNQIPVWSGMARGAIKKVGDMVGYQVPIFPVPEANPSKGPGPRIDQGVANSTAKLITVPGRYGFEWSTSVDHLAFNDQNDANNYGFHLKHTPRPWEFKENADQAFKDMLNVLILKSDVVTSVVSQNMKITKRSL